MDYSKMSDFEINRAVAIAHGFPPDDCDIAKLGSSLVGVEWDEDTGYANKAFDYCNNPADAWPIILSNGISLVKYEYEHGMWLASSDAYWVDGVEWQIDGEAHPRPLRAAMIVFLKMQESANVQTNPARSDIR
ncbi:phage protein NinX family protein [Leclercia sp. CFBP8987]|uniref:phage protein NinX family protein n=1 Tax=Leclercia sp. CFBP8987 TaxID=3096525 RepID=UPI002A69ED2E|nr:phage protein NinX family protein [Leclercia sp. CFBP8987]MDY0921975.1 phage protein NinX family protein [Leclercia sp. CFBP8987]